MKLLSAYFAYCLIPGITAILLYGIYSLIALATKPKPEVRTSSKRTDPKPSEPNNYIFLSADDENIMWKPPVIQGEIVIPPAQLHAGYRALADPSRIVDVTSISREIVKR
jgi:hypothetical protein